MRRDRTPLHLGRECSLKTRRASRAVWRVADRCLCRPSQVVLCGRFNVPLKAANKGNGKNLAAHSAPTRETARLDFTARLPDCRSPLVGDWRPETTKRPLRLQIQLHV